MKANEYMIVRACALRNCTREKLKLSFNILISKGTFKIVASSHECDGNLPKKWFFLVGLR
jgi:hypothetical protein